MNANTNMFTDIVLLSPCERAGAKAAEADTLGPEWKAVHTKNCFHMEKLLF